MGTNGTAVLTADKPTIGADPSDETPAGRRGMFAAKTSADPADAGTIDPVALANADAVVKAAARAKRKAAAEAKRKSGEDASESASATEVLPAPVGTRAAISAERDRIEGAVFAATGQRRPLAYYQQLVVQLGLAALAAVPAIEFVDPLGQAAAAAALAIEQAKSSSDDTADASGDQAEA